MRSETDGLGGDGTVALDVGATGTVVLYVGATGAAGVVVGTTTEGATVEGAGATGVVTGAKVGMVSRLVTVVALVLAYAVALKMVATLVKVRPGRTSTPPLPPHVRPSAQQPYWPLGARSQYAVAGHPPARLGQQV